jgi:hypothetical protein
VAGSGIGGNASLPCRGPSIGMEGWLPATASASAHYELAFFVEHGRLISYAADTVDIWRRAAFFVDKILN